MYDTVRYTVKLRFSSASETRSAVGGKLARVGHQAGVVCMSARHVVGSTSSHSHAVRRRSSTRNGGFIAFAMHAGRYRDRKCRTCGPLQW